MTRMTARAGVNALVEEVLPQGGWRDGDCLRLIDHARRLVEFTDGFLEVLPMPSREHQRIVAFLSTMLRAHLRGTGGEVLFVPLRLRIRHGKFREPDLVVLRDSEDVRGGSLRGGSAHAAAACLRDAPLILPSTVLLVVAHGPRSAWKVTVSPADRYRVGVQRAGSG